jgi:hypothetical protein
MTIKKKKRSSDSVFDGQRLLQLAALGILVTIFAIGGLGLGSPNTNTTTAATPTVGNGSPTAMVFPTVAPGGSVLTPDRTFFHSTGLYSLPHFAGFDLAPDGEEKVDPAAGGSNTTFSRVGSTFINASLLSVIHVFAEQDKDKANPVNTLSDLDKHYDKVNLDGAWANFTGGYKETKRGIEGDKYVIDFQLFLNGNTYLARLVTKLEGDWRLVTRLVVPDNNPGLLDALTAQIWPSFVFHSDGLSAPISWNAVADPVLGYLLRYPNQWTQLEGYPGRQFVVSGTLNNNPVTLTTKGEPSKTAKTEQEARAWVTALRPNATIYQVKPETRGDASGFTLSYNDPDADGNSRSAIVTLLNGANGTLYSANYILNARNIDLLGTVNVPPELAQSRGTFAILSTAKFVPTLTPTATWTPEPTSTPTPQGSPVAGDATATSTPAN